MKKADFFKTKTTLIWVVAAILCCVGFTVCGIYATAMLSASGVTVNGVGQLITVLTVIVIMLSIVAIIKLLKKTDR